MVVLFVYIYIFIFIYIHMNPNKRHHSVFRMVYMMFSTYFAWFVYMNTKKVGLVWGCGNTTVKVPNIIPVCRSTPIF